MAKRCYSLLSDDMVFFSDLTNNDLQLHKRRASLLDCSVDKYQSLKRPDQIPNCVIEQLLHPKNHLEDITMVPSAKKSKAVVAFFFKPNDIQWIKYLNSSILRYSDAIEIIGITPCSISIDANIQTIADEDGKICSRMNLRDPLGGGIYPISSIIIFNSSGAELVRFKVGIDEEIVDKIIQVVIYCLLLHF